MSSPLQDGLAALSDAMERTSISATQEHQCDNDPPSLALVPKLPTPPKKIDRDPFRLLPWFAIEYLILKLHDLPTLHHLYRASPAVTDYLNHTAGFFPKVVERLMERWQDRDGYDWGHTRDIQVFFRTLVYLWWKEEFAATGEFVPSDGNPLPNVFQDETFYTVNLSTFCSMKLWFEGNWVGDIPLPPSTPPQILRRLLSLSTRIRRDAHAFFHSCVHLCFSSNIKRLTHRKRPWPRDGTRPHGTQIGHCKDETYGLSWIEEQRLTLAFLKPYMFSTLRRIICEKGIVKSDPSLTVGKNWCPHTFNYLQEGNLIGFWAPFAPGWTESVDMEQLLTVVSWLDTGKPLHGMPLKGPDEFITCCPEVAKFDPTREELMSIDPLHQRSIAGCFWAQTCMVVPQSGVKEAGLRGKFRKFGVSFWHNTTMIWLGLMLPRITSHDDRKDLAFRWTSLLEPKGEEKLKDNGKKLVKRPPAGQSSGARPRGLMDTSFSVHEVKFNRRIL
ncbi:hypothetical protein N7491_002411 [Penicillium cf. griseofulvum]|uniref:Uncharacterized protein n=1 Tax=Penicillium cf. griseofulvum TaxID=2972120 RepID=A0A9W9T2E5_9EURO|nr:hypothetical protein N7472_003406 [Penicillium cf. griseofulvum]KAJ5446329.1 hypothetical protein N7491_002411 [Penicillium cf. griseofulvum]